MTNKMKRIHFRILRIFLIATIFLSTTSTSNAQFEIRMSRTDAQVNDCVSRCNNFGVWNGGPNNETITGNSWGCGTDGCYNMYTVHKYGNASWGRYKYRRSDGRYQTTKWGKCKGNFTTCDWYRYYVHIPTCQWNSGYGYRADVEVPNSNEKREIGNQDPVALAREECKNSSYARDCLASCQAKASLFVNGKPVASTLAFIDALTAEESVEALIKKVGPDKMVDIYDPNCVAR